MPLYGGSAGRSGGGSPYLAGGMYSARSSSPTPKKKKPKRWLGALAEQLEDFAWGFLPGMVELGKAGYSDVDRLTGGALPGKDRGSFQYDDIGKAIVVDTKDRWAPLFRGDFREFREQIATRPLDFLLDLSLVVPVVGAGAKAGTAARLAGGSKLPARAASQPDRVLRMAGFVPRTAEAMEDAAAVYGKNSREFRQGAHLGVVRGVRRIGADLAREGRYKNASADGSAVLMKPLKTNPLLAKRDAGVDRVLGSARMEKAPGIGTAARAARADRRRPTLAADVRRQKLLTDPVKKLRKVKTADEQLAWYLLHEGTDPRKWAQTLRQKANDVDATDRDRAFAVQMAKRITQPDVVRMYVEKPKHVMEAVRATKRLADDDLGELMQQLGWARFDLLERRLLTERVMDGAKAVDAHPERVRAREGALGRVADQYGDPDAVRISGGPRTAQRTATGPAPSDAQVRELLTAAQRQLIHGRYRIARGNLRRWLNSVYNEARYGTPNPDPKMVRTAQGKQLAARGRQKRRANAKQVPGITDLLKTVDQYGAWSRQAARLADEGGPMRRQLWAKLRDERKADLRMQDAPAGSLEAKLAQHGYHPDDPLANLPGDDGMVDVIVEWIEESTNGESLASIARGVVDSLLDPIGARALIQEAQRLDPDLPDDPPNELVAEALAARYQPLDVPDSIPSRKAWVDQVHDAILAVYENAPDEIDAPAELGRIRGDAARMLANRLGLRDPEMGVEPSGADWAKALAQVARESGFDEGYRRQARALRGSERAVADRGAEVFRGEFEPMPLKRELDATGRPYGDKQLVNPETGRLYRDEALEAGEGALAQAAEGKSYFPHLAPRGPMRGPGSVRAVGASKREPALPSNVTKKSIGARFESGAFDNSPTALLEQASAVIRSMQAKDVYNAALLRGVDFDAETYHSTGGSKAWVVGDVNMQRGLEKALSEQDSFVQAFEALLPEDSHAEFVRALSESKAITSRNARRAESGEQGLVMIPRAYYDKLSSDLKQSSAAARLLVDRPLDVFRSLVLFLRPAYYANNVVGQHLLLGVKDPTFVPAYIRFLAARNMNGARQVFGEAASNPQTGWQAWSALLDDFASETRGAAVFDVEIPGSTTMGFATRWRLGDNRSKRAMARAIQAPGGLARFGAIISDDLPRQFRFIRLMQPHIKDARRAGMNGDDSTIARKLLEGDEVLRDRIVDRTLRDLIDYRSMSPVERRQVRRVIPFYGWMRGFTEWMAELAYDDPGRFYALAQVSNVGQDANEWTEGMPRWMQGVISLGDEREGERRVLTTSGLSPFSTLADVTGIMRGAFMDDPSRNPEARNMPSQFNPYLIALIQGGLNGGKQLGSPFQMLPYPGAPRTGATEPMSRRGGLGAAAMGWASELPAPMLLTQYRTQKLNEQKYGQPASPNSIFNSPFRDYLLSNLGYPVRNVQVAAAQRRGAEDEAMRAGEGRGF